MTEAEQALLDAVVRFPFDSAELAEARQAVLRERGLGAFRAMWVNATVERLLAREKAARDFAAAMVVAPPELVIPEEWRAEAEAEFRFRAQSEGDS